MDILLVVIASFFIIRRQKLEWALVIIMALGTNMFQVSKIFKDSMLIPNMTDGALILILLMFILFKNRKTDTTPYKGIQKTAIIFFSYLAFITLIDIVINNTSIISVLKTSRHWLCLLVLFVIPKLPYDKLYKALHITFYITVITSTIIIIEYLIGTEYFTTSIVEDGIRRGALPSYYALFYTILVFTNYYKFPKIKKYIFLAILIVSQLVSATRSISMAIVLGIAICIWYLSENKLASFLKLIGLCAVIYLASYAMPSLNKRFNDTFDELAGMEQSSKNLDTEGNMTFRLYMLTERYQYLKTKPQYYLFGIGNVIEQHFPTTFMIGGFNEEMQRPTQLDTGDISWSPLILRLGMLGLIIYLFLTSKFILFKTFSKNDKLYITLKAYIWTTLIVLSFSDYKLSRGEYWIMPMICITMICQKYFYNKQQSITH